MLRSKLFSVQLDLQSEFLMKTSFRIFPVTNLLEIHHFLSCKITIPFNVSVYYTRWEGEASGQSYDLLFLLSKKTTTKCSTCPSLIMPKSRRSFTVSQVGLAVLHNKLWLKQAATLLKGESVWALWTLFSSLSQSACTLLL